jgi:serine/threonine protein kinase
VDVPVERYVARSHPEGEAELRGRQLGDFVLRECIGEGAFAKVYRSDQPLLGREAVVKVLHQRLRGSEVAFQRFMREARLASRLDHPYAAHVYAFGVEPDDGLAWIAMELVHGTSLERWLKERGTLSLDLLVSFFEDVAEVVQNAHDHGIVHRDLKPSNVMMIEYAGKLFPKLLDFGIAKLVDETAQHELPGALQDDPPSELPAGSGNYHLTQANATLGSPPYMSPEQWVDALSVGPRSDLYSLAVMAYEALTGRQPFVGPTIAAIGEQHCNAEVPPVGEAFSPALDRMFRRALAKNPDERPPSARAFASELRTAALAPPEPPRIALTQPLTSLRPRRRTWLWGGGAAALAVGGLAIYAVIARGQPAPRPGFARPIEPSPPPAPAPAPAAAASAPAPASAPPPAAPAAPATVAVAIESTPRGAEVFRLPSGTKVGATPWRGELQSDAGTQLFLIRKPGFLDRRVEIDLRTGGTRSVTLQRAPRRVAPPATPPQVRQKGEPVDPFRPSKSR